MSEINDPEHTQWLVHGLVVELRANTDLSYLLLPWLNHFEQLSATRVGTQKIAAKTLVIDLKWLQANDPSDPRFADYQPVFFYGTIQGFIGPRGVLLSDLHSRIEISPEGLLIQIDLSAESGAMWQYTNKAMIYLALLIAFRSHHLFDLHAAGAVGTSGLGLVIIGESGSGKTSLLLSLLASGANYLGDDRVLLRSTLGERSTRDAVDVLAYPREFHISPKSWALLGQRAEQPPALVGQESKHVVPAQLYFGERFVGSMNENKVLLFPQITASKNTVLKPMNKAEAFGQILLAAPMATLDFMPHHQEHLHVLQHLSKLPCFAVYLGEDLLLTPAQVASQIVSQINETNSFSEP